MGLAAVGAMRCAAVATGGFPRFIPACPVSWLQVAIMAALPQHERIARMLGSVNLPDAGPCLVMAYYPHTLQVGCALQPCGTACRGGAWQRVFQQERY